MRLTCLYRLGRHTCGAPAEYVEHYAGEYIPAAIASDNPRCAEHLGHFEHRLATPTHRRETVVEYLERRRAESVFAALTGRPDGDQF